MAHGNEILFARIAIRNGLITDEQLEQCLAIQRKHAQGRHIALIMLERGLIDDIQIRAILSVQRRRLHKGGRSTSKDFEVALSKLLLEEKLVTEKDVKDARAAKDEMEERGLFPAIGDILVQRGVLTLEKLNDCISRIDKTELWCENCGKKYRAYGYHDGIKAKCRVCKGTLETRELSQKTPQAEHKDLGEHVDVSIELASVADIPEPIEPTEPFDVEIPDELRSRRSKVKTKEREPKVGDIIGGCELMENIGAGGWGQIFRAHHKVLDSTVAIKILAPKKMGGQHLIQRFMAEARSAARLNHPNIVVVHDVGEDDGVFFIRMQYIAGKSLQALLAKYKTYNIKRALQITKQVAEALNYAHGYNMVHRDIKPANIMVGEENHVTLVDFGLTKDTTSDAHITSAGVVVGTVHYMSPEQGNGGVLDGRTDLYSLGVTLYEMLTGKVPFDGDTPWKVLLAHQKELAPDPTLLRPDIPESLAQLVKAMLAKEPDARPSDGSVVAGRIDSILKHL